MSGFFNFDTIEVGTQLSVETIEKFINEQQSCNEVPQHGVGEFVMFANSRAIVENKGMLNMAPNGEKILIREHYEVDIFCQKCDDKWYIYGATDRRTVN